MRAIAIGLAVLMMVGASPVWAADYTAEGRVIAEGYAGPGISDHEIAYLAGLGAITAAVEFWDVSRLAVTAALVGATLGWGVYRKAYWDDQGIQTDLGGSPAMEVESGTAQELLDA